MRLRILACAILSAFTLSALAGPVGINAAGQVLIDRGQSLLGQGQAQQALDAYREAAKADPESSVPDSMSAGLFGYLADRNTGEQRAQPSIRMVELRYFSSVPERR